jgi:DNA-directed RNA polymerase specialized sigma24 family protein
MSVRVGEVRPTIEYFESYLLLRAWKKLGPDSVEKIEAGDVVQDTLLKAHRDLEKFRGTTQREMAGGFTRFWTAHSPTPFARPNA